MSDPLGGFPPDRRIGRGLTGPGGLIRLFVIHAPCGVVVAGIGSTLRTGLGILRIEDGIKIVVGALECSGFFEAPMSPLFHGLAPVGEIFFRVYRAGPAVKPSAPEQGS